MSLETVMTIAAILALLAVSALLTAARVALTAAPRRRPGPVPTSDRVNSQVNQLRDRRDEITGGLLIASILVNVTATALAIPLAIAWYGPGGLFYAALAMTALISILAEALPRLYALGHRNRLALRLAPLVQALLVVLGPLARGQAALVWRFVRADGEDKPTPPAKVAEEELRGAIERHGRRHGEDRQERAMLRSILDLADVEVGQIMVHRRNLTAIDADQPSAAILEEALASPHTRVPLWRGQPDNIIGVLHAKALLRALRAHAGRPEAIDIAELIQPPWFVPESTTLLDQLQAFRQRRERLALVVDEYGALMGIVTLQDILEEIVGEIGEDLGSRMPGVRLQRDASYIVGGQVAIRDLNREYDWHLPDDEASTIAGLVLYEARQIPEVGQSFIFHGFRFEVLRRRRHQITTLRVTPPPKPEEVGEALEEGTLSEIRQIQS